MNDVAMIRSGDEKAFSSFFRHYHPRLYQYFHRKTSSAYLTEELVQLTFIKLWNSRHTLKDEFPAELQLFQIARTSLIDLLRREASARERLQDMVGQVTSEPLADPFTRTDANETIEAALAKLPPARRNIFRLSREFGYSHKEIAASLRITPKTVENQIAKALRQLRNFFFFL